MINNPDREIYAIPDACFDIQFVYENSTFIPYVCGTHTQVSRAFISDSRKIFAVKFEPGVVPDFIKEYACELVCARKFYPGGVPYLCMFDVGDSFYTLGTIYALAQVRLNQGNKSEKCNINLLYIIKSLFSSVPFVVYFTMTVLSFLNFHLPSVIVEIADFCGHGNGFLAMMMIGISLEINMSRDTFREVIHLLALRYAIGIVSAILIFCILPAPLVMRQILAAAVFSSSAAVSIIYSEKLGVPTDIAAALNPISTICMIPLMVIVIMLTM